MMWNQNKRLILATISIVILVSVGLAIFYHFFTFHITNTSPSRNAFSQYTAQVAINFNKDIHTIAQVKTTPVGILHDYNVDKNSLKIDLEKLPVDEQITITLIGVLSSDGYGIESQTITFMSSKIDPADIPEDQLKHVLEVQDRNTDANSDPIFQFVPYSTPNYTLGAEAIGFDAGKNGNIYGISLTLHLSSADVRIDREGAIKAYTDEALLYLKSKNVNLDNYKVTTTVDEPSLY